MRVIVILGRVLDPRGITVNRRVGRIFVNRKEYILQPADRCALEAALRIKDSADCSNPTGVEVVALPRAPLPDDDLLRLALATGADRAVYLVGNPAQADEAVMARVLAATVEQLGGADLVLTGATTLDTGQSQLGPRLAEALGWPQIVNAWAVKAAGERVEVVCQNKTGYVIHDAALPAVVTMTPGSLKTRYPDGVRLVNVYKGVGEIAAALEQWEVADLVDAEFLNPLLEPRGRDFPPMRERGTRASGTVDEMAQAAADALRQRAQSRRGQRPYGVRR